ncbi:hypothetical protein AF332_00580 [Sporosarcina globispora]|uniref:Uncharacterized protein n=1 Tax=Sporosarcina globispora TaxID=1459 RepID=A0A0M0G7W6_SPOGL|nr:hypothetical protein [Sporosarcina globispora]KON85511.1 hypothetical protein AF332_00580 [Sporosarcina globispora]
MKCKLNRIFFHKNETSTITFRIKQVQDNHGSFLFENSLDNYRSGAYHSGRSVSDCERAFYPNGAATGGFEIKGVPKAMRYYSVRLR